MNLGFSGPAAVLLDRHFIDLIRFMVLERLVSSYAGFSIIAMAGELREANQRPA